MAVRRVNGRWIVEFEQGGRRVFRRLPRAATKAQASELETRLRQRLIDQQLLGKVPDVGLQAAIEVWLRDVVRGRKSESQTGNHAGRVSDALSGHDWSVARIADAASAIRDDDALSPATRNRRLCILKAVAKFAWRKGWTQENLSPKIQLLPEKTARHIYITQDQVEALIHAAATPDIKAFIAIAVFTGLRQGEVMALTKDDIGQTGLIVRDSKIGEPRIVPYLGDKTHLAAIPFTSHKRTLYAGFEAARDAADMPWLRYHDLRHTTASLLINAGVDLYTVGEILGHKSAQTTKRYAHLSVKSKRDALGKVFGAAWTNNRNTGKGRKSKSARKNTLRRGSQSRDRKSA